jgi:hypothetical protein
LAHAPATASRITAKTTKAAAASAPRTARPLPGEETAAMIPSHADGTQAAHQISRASRTPATNRVARTGLVC